MRTSAHEDECSSSTAIAPQQQQQQEAEFMTIISEKTGESKTRNTRHIDFTLRFAPTRHTAIDPEQQLTDVFQRLYDRSFGGGRELPAGIIIQVHPPNWEKEFTIPLRPLCQNSPEAVAAALIKVNEEYNGGLDLFDGTSEVRIIAVWKLDPTRGLLVCLLLLVYAIFSLSLSLSFSFSLSLSLFLSLFFSLSFTPV